MECDIPEGFIKMANYNISNFTQAQTVADVVKASNDLSAGALFNFGIIAIFIILVLSMKRYRFSNALLASSWVCFMLSSILSYAGFLNITFPITFFVLSGLVTIYIYTAESD